MRPLHAPSRRSSDPGNRRRRRFVRQQRRRRLALESLEDRALLAAFVVTNTDDSGPGSLRRAMADAEAAAGVDQIEFDIDPADSRHFYYQDNGVAGQVSRSHIATTTAANDGDIADIDPDWPHSWFSIQPASPLPDITNPVQIDGYTQSGASANTNAVESGLGLNTVLKIELDGNQLNGSGLILDGQNSGASTIRGLALNRFFSRAILGQNSGLNRIEGNFLGTDVSGTIGLASQTVGAEFTGGGANGNNVVGGLTPDARNLIAGSQGGVSFFNTGFFNQVLGNLIGTDISGTVAIGHTQYGVNVHGVEDTIIGGADVNARNIISGNFRGVYVQGGPSSVNTVIQGNYIGVDVSGAQPLGNSRGIQNDGVNTSVGRVDGAGANARNVISANSEGIRVTAPSFGQQTQARIQGNYIGVDAGGQSPLGNGVGIRLMSGTRQNLIGTDLDGVNDAHEGNVISANGAGIKLEHVNNRDSVIRGNLIGLAADGAAPLGNTGNGILVFAGAGDHTIGGVEPGAGNRIAHNGAAGVRIDDPQSTNVALVGNSIFDNTLLGIDLAGGDESTIGFDVTLNDAGDADTGANGLQNYPLLTDVTIGGGGTHVAGTLHSAPDTTYRIEFFTSTAADPSGHGEGADFLGFAEVTTDANGDAAFAVDLPVEAPPDHVIAATATRLLDHDGVAGTPLVPVETSEFSAVLATPAAQLPDLDVFIDAAASAEFGGPLPLTLTITNNGPSSIAANTPISYSLYLSEDATIDNSDRLLTPTSSVALNSPLEAGETITLSLSPLVSATWPDAEIVAGDVYIGAAIDENNAIDESDETNNTAAEPISILYLPDLVVVSITAPAVAYLDQPLGEQLTVRIRNNGPAPFNGGIFTADFYVSTDATITTSDRKLNPCIGLDVCFGNAVQSPSLEPGEEFDVSVSSSILNVSSTVPDSNPPLGDAYIGFIVDAGNFVDETNEDNNASVALPITISNALPDLEVVSFTAPAELFLDQPSDQFTLRVRNNGPAPFQGPLRYNDVFYISVDSTITAADRRLVLGPNTVNLGALSINLDPGEEADFVVAPLRVSSTEPDSNPLLGDVYIGVLLDADDEIDETDETNNASAAVPITVSELPDLEVVSFTAPAAIFTDQPLQQSVKVLVRNNGPAALETCPDVNLYISTDETITTNDRPLQDNQGSGCALLGLFGGVWEPGEEMEFTFFSGSISSTFPDLNPPSGDVYLGVIVDETDEILESNDSNNTAAVPVRIVQPQTQLATYVNDDWHFESDADGSGGLSYGDLIRNDNDTAGPTVTAHYGIDGFGSVTSGTFTGSGGTLDDINDAIRATATGGAITVLQGNYDGQIIIDRNVDIIGATGTATDVVIDPEFGDGFRILGPESGSSGDVGDATDVSIEGLSVDAGLYGVFAAGVSGNLNIQNVESTSNNFAFFFVGVGDVEMTDVVATDSRFGVLLSGAESFTDTNGKYLNNREGGISLRDVSGNVTLTSTTANDNHGINFAGAGLRVEDGNDEDDVAIGGDLLIQGADLSDVEGADGDFRQVRGVLLDGSVGGSITVSGLDANEDGEIDEEERTTISGNQSEGFLVEQGVSGAVSFSHVSLNNNDGSGAVFQQTVSGNVDFDNVRATNNGGDGIEFTDRVFGDIVFTDVTASGNDPGLRIRRAGSFSDTDGIYNGNADHGIWLRQIDGDVTLTGTTLNDNDADNDGIGDGLNSSTDGGGLIVVIGDANPPLPIGGNLVIIGATMIDSVDDPAPQQSGLAVQQTGGQISIVGATAPIDIVNQTIQAGANFNLLNAAVNLLETSIEVADDLTLVGASALSLDAGSSVDADTIVVHPGNMISGGGVLSANQVINNGVIDPGFSPGKLTIDGNFTQGPQGVLTIEIGGPTPVVDYDVLCVTGDATFAGVIEFVLTGGYMPQPGDVLQALDVAGSLDLSEAQTVLPQGLQNFGGAVVAPPDGGATLVDDGGQQLLIVGGTPDGDRIIFYTVGDDEEIFVRVGGETLGGFSLPPDGRVIVFGAGGDDVITLAGNLHVAAELHGGPGNDYLAGAGGDDVLLGGPGRDRLLGDEGHNLLDGGRGNDYLAARSGNDVLLGGTGSDRMFAGGGDDLVDGGAGNDFIAGGRGDDILLGGDDDDLLAADGGRDLLIGGYGVDWLTAGDDNDILIGGSTKHDNDDEALLAILAEWTSAGDFNTRIANLQGGGGLNGSAVLKIGDTVFDDGDRDQLLAGGDPDWLFQFALDHLHHLQAEDVVASP